MASPLSGIRMIPGSSQILVVAPHGPFIRGRYQNDVLTGVMAVSIQAELGCTAIINDLYFKPKGPLQKDRNRYLLDLYRIDHAGKVPGYLEAIRAVVDTDAKTLVLWMHGLSDVFAAVQARFHIAKGAFDLAPAALDALIAYGQGGDPKTGEAFSRYTARPETAQAFRDHLNRLGMSTVLTHPEAQKYRGRDAKRLNQWFNQLGYGLDRVESIELEVKVSGFRDSEENATHAGRLIAKALSAIAPDLDR
jgi:hypothetical protein